MITFSLIFETHEEGKVRKKSHDPFCKNYPQAQKDKNCKIKHVIFESKSLPLLKKTKINEIQDITGLPCPLKISDT